MTGVLGSTNARSPEILRGSFGAMIPNEAYRVKHKDSRQAKPALHVFGISRLSPRSSKERYNISRTDFTWRSTSLGLGNELANSLYVSRLTARSYWGREVSNVASPEIWLQRFFNSQSAERQSSGWTPRATFPFCADRAIY